MMKPTRLPDEESVSTETIKNDERFECFLFVVTKKSLVPTSLLPLATVHMDLGPIASKT